MKVLLLGANGQLGWELQRTKTQGVELVALGSTELDIRDEAAVQEAVQVAAPDVLINAAAYTAVDRAEEEQEFAYAVNGQGAKNLALASKAVGAFMIQVSTDYVFDGRSSYPYTTDTPPAPLGAYGLSKLEGEKQVALILGQECVIVRSSWLYSSHGNNFVKTMHRLMTEREELSVIDDQVGTPTWARGLAEAVWRVCEMKQGGTLHWSDAGVATWYDFAVAIQEEALTLGILDREIPIRPIGTQDYPTPAKRPAFSVLDKQQTWRKLEMQPEHWRKALRKMLQDYKESLGA